MVGGTLASSGSVSGARSPPAGRSGPGGAATDPLRRGVTTTMPRSRRPERAYYCIINAERVKKSTCHGLSRHFRHPSSPAPLGRSSTQSVQSGPGVSFRRSRSSLGWGGDKARHSCTTVIWKALCQRRSGAASGLGEQLGRSGSRIRPQQRSESSPLSTVQHEDAYIDSTTNALVRSLASSSARPARR